LVAHQLQTAEPDKWAVLAVLVKAATLMWAVMEAPVVPVEGPAAVVPLRQKYRKPALS
jgi:predicted nuclease of restriction endonuclease-like RecB superfamily